MITWTKRIQIQTKRGCSLRFRGKWGQLKPPIHMICQSWGGSRYKKEYRALRKWCPWTKNLLHEVLKKCPKVLKVLWRLLQEARSAALNQFWTISLFNLEGKCCLKSWGEVNDQVHHGELVYQFLGSKGAIPGFLGLFGISKHDVDCYSGSKNAEWTLCDLTGSFKHIWFSAPQAHREGHLVPLHSSGCPCTHQAVLWTVEYVLHNKGIQRNIVTARVRSTYGVHHVSPSLPSGKEIIVSVVQYSGPKRFRYLRESGAASGESLQGWHASLIRGAEKTPGPVFCLFLRVSSGCAWPITGEVTSVTWPVIGWAYSELTLSKRQKTGPGLLQRL